MRRTALIVFVALSLLFSHTAQADTFLTNPPQDIGFVLTGWNWYNLDGSTSGFTMVATTTFRLNTLTMWECIRNGNGGQILVAHAYKGPLYQLEEIATSSPHALPNSCPSNINQASYLVTQDDYRSAPYEFPQGITLNPGERLTIVFEQLIPVVGYVQFGARATRMDADFVGMTGPTSVISPPNIFLPDHPYYPAFELGTTGCLENCNSNVLFLHGLQASRLYRPDYDGGTDRLWEPNTNSDVEELFLDAEGRSLRTDVYTKDILDEAFGFGPDVYETFIDMMDELRDEHIITDWSAAPYDWRLSLADIITYGRVGLDKQIFFDPINGATTTPFILQELERLTKNSKTGNVTIIAHSNGGLVAKALLQKLEDTNSPLLAKVDKVIFLASPQLGTPKAIASMLHGEGQELGFGHLLNKPTARTLAAHMPGAYHLLPSPKYFELVQDPPVFIRERPSTQMLYDTYGTSIESHVELRRMLIGEEGRITPATSDWETPSLLSATLFAEAEDVHMLIDSWTPPASMKVVEVAGWGLDTIKGMRYTDRYDEGCDCMRITYIPLFTDEGDETVVVPSALAMGVGERYWVDLAKSNKEFDENGKHANFTEARPIQNWIKEELANSLSLPKFVSTSSPPNSGSKKLRYTLHSPLSLSVSDNGGRYTGLSTSTISGVELPRIIEQIPNSYYMEFGETKIIGVPEGTSTVRMIGESLGIFTLDVERIEGGQTILTTVFPDIPVATGTIVMLEQGDANASTTLQIDMDGNGSIDLVIGEEGFSDLDGVVLLRHLISELNLGEKQEDKLLRTVDQFEKVILKEFKKEERKTRKLSHVVERLESRVTTFEIQGKMTHDDATEMQQLIDIVREKVL